ncbi:hypothetical protein [Pedobacter frigidisoli]|uniref:hypothetical protein n=1 Tax=Pedobacter frigidisoli TaxID=2530455 RepID=UPI00293181FF|nr:hypothetical protein [Pedobacter frigidisoli]
MEKESNINRNKRATVSRLNQKMLFLQQRLADHLNAKCRNISSKVLRALLITFIVLMSAALLNLIINAIQ